MSKYGIVILGLPTTTGFGTTQFALRLAVEWAKAYNEVKRLPKEDAVVVFSNTIDVAKEVQLKPGYVWVMDEMNPSDSTQAIHMGENMMKVLMAPTVPGSVRCRNADLMLPAGVLRIFTGNAASAQTSGSLGQSPSRGRQSSTTSPSPSSRIRGQTTRRTRKTTETQRRCLWRSETAWAASSKGGPLSLLCSEA